VSILDCVDENLLEVQSSDGDNEIFNRESDSRSGISESEQSDGQVAPVVSGWHDVKWQMKIWLLDTPNGMMSILNIMKMQGDQKVTRPIPDTCSICQKINYTEKQKTKNNVILSVGNVHRI
jgi:hypothetical protein